MKSMVMWMMVGLGLLQCAQAGELRNFKSWVEHVGQGDPRGGLKKLGLSDPAAQARVANSWEEAKVLETLLDANAMWLMRGMLRSERLSPEGYAGIVERVKRDGLPRGARNWFKALPLENRLELATEISEAVRSEFKERPVYGEHLLKYYLLGEGNMLSADCGIPDLVTFVLAPEPLNLPEAERVKSAIHEAAVRQAKVHLREQGRSFVVRDGVNPLVAVVAPVVDALNAPGCAGLEAALRGIGVAMEDRDRTDLERIGQEWSAAAMRGELTGSQLNARLGRVSIALGVGGFNAFVEDYNQGGGGEE